MKTASRIQKAIQKKVDKLLKEYFLITPEDDQNDKEIVSMIVNFLKIYTEHNYSNTKDFDVSLKTEVNGSSQTMYK
jgi:hypothetical protein